MEIIASIVLVLAFWVGSNNKQEPKPAPAPTKTEMQDCRQMCESGMVETYKNCRCLAKPVWKN